MEKKTKCFYLSPVCKELDLLIENSILSGGDDGMEEGGEV